MALIKSRNADVPKNAVPISEIEALKYQMKLVKGWDKLSDVFALKYGPYILGSATVLSGAFFNSHFRRKFMLGSYGSMASYLPICVVPSMISMILHSELVLRNVILLKSDQCPVCLESRAAALQAGAGVVLPLIIAPLGCAALAVRYVTYDMPYLHEKPREAFGIFSKMFHKIKTKTFYLFLGQAFLASVMTYFEFRNIMTMTEKLNSREPELLLLN